MIIFKTKRAVELGYKPQREIVYNFLLPYSSDIDSKFLIKIKFT